MTAEALGWLALSEAWRCLLSELAEYHGLNHVVVRDLSALNACLPQAPDTEHLNFLVHDPHSWAALLDARCREVGVTARPTPVCAGEAIESGANTIPLLDLAGAACKHPALDGIHGAMCAYLATVRERQAEW
jgi:hypothetical protein